MAFHLLESKELVIYMSGFDLCIPIRVSIRI
jgi:hypothetical protein